VLLPAQDEELRARQASLPAEAGEVLVELDRLGLFDDVGPPLLAGSCVSGLMCWRDLEVVLLGVVGFEYRDERGTRRPTDAGRDER
jgi:hypothetical protein